MNEFDKLDRFVREHKPAIESLRPISAPKKSWWLALTASAAVAIAVIVTLNIQNQQAALDQEAVAALEAMDWDMSEDEMPTDISDLVALAE